VRSRLMLAQMMTSRLMKVTAYRYRRRTFGMA
jgi:hypothetical protein